jgi:beta-carotene 3-hydroxylase
MAQMWLVRFVIVAATVAAMEGIATLVHRYVMHGWGWAWHRSHHAPRTGHVERNDLYALLFAGANLLLFMVADIDGPVWWVGIGMALYGLLYGILHDGLVHRRVPAPAVPRRGYLKRLVQAHRLHHATRAREGAVSFGFLYAPPVQQLRRRMRGDGATQ